MLVSVHIPKTGGVTFRSLLKKHFGAKLLYDYEDRPMSDPTLLRNIKAYKHAITSGAKKSDYHCVHGHFMPVKYKFGQGKSFVIWLRHPADRIVSRYYYMKRHSDFSSAQFNTYIRDKNISLEDFCKIPHFHNLYSKYLWGFSLDLFDFIGITEAYEESLDRFSDTFNIDLGVGAHENANDNMTKENGGYHIDSKILNLIYKKNKKDFLIYEKATSMY